MQQKLAFAVPLTNGAYAPEVLEIREGIGLPLSFFQDLSVLIEALPTGAQVELDLLRVGAPITTPAAGDWVLNVAQGTANGFYNPIAGCWRGGRLRVKSGGTSGSAIVSAHWRAGDRS